MNRLIFMFIFISFGASANPICDNKAKLGHLLYSNFMSTSHTLQHTFVGYYQGVSKKFDKALNSACSKKLNLQGTTNEIIGSCLEACRQDAFNFFDTALGRKILFNECSTLCNVTSRTIHTMGLAFEENGCKLGNAPLNVNDSEAIKEISDKIKKNDKASSGATPQ